MLFRRKNQHHPLLKAIELLEEKFVEINNIPFIQMADKGAFSKHHVILYGEAVCTETWLSHRKKEVTISELKNLIAKNKICKHCLKKLCLPTVLEKFWRRAGDTSHKAYDALGRYTGINNDAKALAYIGSSLSFKVLTENFVKSYPQVRTVKEVIEGLALLDYHCDNYSYFAFNANNTTNDAFAWQRENEAELPKKLFKHITSFITAEELQKEALSLIASPLEEETELFERSEIMFFDEEGFATLKNICRQRAPLYQHTILLELALNARKVLEEYAKFTRGEESRIYIENTGGCLKISSSLKKMLLASPTSRYGAKYNLIEMEDMRIAFHSDIDYTTVNSTYTADQVNMAWQLWSNSAEKDDFYYPYLALKAAKLALTE